MYVLDVYISIWGGGGVDGVSSMRNSPSLLYKYISRNLEGPGTKILNMFL